MNNRELKIGMALGGGGVRGLAHVLALEVLDELGVKPAHIVGTSMGSIVGALYASGKSGKEMRELVEQHIISREDSLKDIYRKKRNLFKWLSAFSLGWSKRAFLKADGFLEFLTDQMQVDNFEELQIPFQVVAADYFRAKPVVFKRGPILPAITASMAIPGVFAPVERDGKVLVDGGLVNNLPYDLLPDDCDVTIAIDVGSTWEEGAHKAPNMVDATVGMFDILVDKLVEAKVRENPPTIYIRPKLVGIRTLDFDKIEDVFNQAWPAMQELKSTLEKHLE